MLTRTRLTHKGLCRKNFGVRSSHVPGFLLVAEHINLLGLNDTLKSPLEMGSEYSGTTHTLTSVGYLWGDDCRALGRDWRG